MIELQPTLYRFFAPASEQLASGLRETLEDRWGGIPADVVIATEPAVESTSTSVVFLIDVLGDSTGPGALLSEAQSLRECSPDAARIAVLLRRDAEAHGLPGSERVELRWIETALAAGVLSAVWVVSATDEPGFLASLCERAFAEAVQKRAQASSKPAAIGVSSMRVFNDAPTERFEAEFAAAVRGAVGEGGHEDIPGAVGEPLETPSPEATRGQLGDSRLLPAVICAIEQQARSAASAVQAELASIRQLEEAAEREAAARADPGAEESATREDVSEPRDSYTDLLAAVTGGAFLGAVLSSQIASTDFGTVCLGALFGAIAAALVVPVLRNFTAAPAENSKAEEAPPSPRDRLEASRREWLAIADQAARQATRVRYVLERLQRVLPAPSVRGHSGVEASAMACEEARKCIHEVAEAASRGELVDAEIGRILEECSRSFVATRVAEWSATEEFVRGTEWARESLGELLRSARPLWPGGNGALVSLRAFSGDLVAGDQEDQGGGADTIIGGSGTAIVARFARGISSADLGPQSFQRSRVA